MYSIQFLVPEYRQDPEGPKVWETTEKHTDLSNARVQYKKIVLSSDYGVRIAKVVFLDGKELIREIIEYCPPKA